MKSTCTLCAKPVVGRGFCKNHYRAFMQHGDAEHHSNMRGVPFNLRYTADAKSGCWLWVGGVTTSGYGTCSMHGQKVAHRVSWVIHNGVIPNGMNVLHRCDTPACVNPAHLFLGTHQDNMADLRQKGRAYGAKGEANYGAVITEDQALSILNDPRSGPELARQYGISQESVSNIRNGKTWRHLFDEDSRTRRIANGPRRLTPAERILVAADPRTQHVIAAEYGVSQSLISQIKRLKE